MFFLHDFVVLFCRGRCRLVAAMVAGKEGGTKLGTTAVLAEDSSHDISRFHSMSLCRFYFTAGHQAKVAGLRVASFLCFSCCVIHVFAPTGPNAQGPVVEARLLGVESPLKCTHGTLHTWGHSVVFVREAVRVCSDRFFGTRSCSVPIMTLPY